MINQSDLKNVRYQAQLDRVREFSRMHQLSSGMREKLHGYHELLFSVNRGFDLHQIAMMFPSSVQKEVFHEEHAPRLRAVPMFRSTECDEVFISALARELRVQVLLDGDYAFKAGEPGDRMYFLKTGYVQITGASSDLVVATVGPGGYFGELALFAAIQTLHHQQDPTGAKKAAFSSEKMFKRSGAARGLSDCILVILMKHDFQVIAERLRIDVQSMMRVATEELRTRRPSFLSAQSGDLPGGLPSEHTHMRRRASRTGNSLNVGVTCVSSATAVRSSSPNSVASAEVEPEGVTWPRSASAPFKRRGTASTTGINSLTSMNVGGIAMHVAMDGMPLTSGSQHGSQLWTRSSGSGLPPTEEHATVTEGGSRRTRKRLPSHDGELAGVDFRERRRASAPDLSGLTIGKFVQKAMLSSPVDSRNSSGTASPRPASPPGEPGGSNTPPSASGLRRPSRDDGPRVRRPSCGGSDNDFSLESLHAPHLLSPEVQRVREAHACSSLARRGEALPSRGSPPRLSPKLNHDDIASYAVPQLATAPAAATSPLQSTERESSRFRERKTSGGDACGVSRSLSRLVASVPGMPSAERRSSNTERRGSSTAPKPTKESSSSSYFSTFM